MSGHPAQYWASDGTTAVCGLCPHHCRVKPGARGLCGPRYNENGKLYTANYGVISGFSLDPVEKKPLYHYYPGRQILSLGTLGCNLNCPFCQNYHLSRAYDEQTLPRTETLSPAALADAVRRLPPGAVNGAAFTYSEPVVWHEYVCDCARVLKNQGSQTVLVTNGFIEKEPLKDWVNLADAANIDLKAFTEAGYRRLRGGLTAVRNTIETMVSAGTHIEITTLLVPGLNCDPDEIRKLAAWLKSLSPAIPLHLSRYFPHYNYHEAATPLKTLELALQAARSELYYVYTGNTGQESDTCCPQCGHPLVTRSGYETSVTGITDKHCSRCGRIADFTL